MSQIALLVLSLSLAMFADEPAKEPAKVAVKLADGKSVEMQTPAGWKVSQSPAGAPFPPTVAMQSKDGDATVQMTFLPDKDGKFATQKQLDELITQIANLQYAGGSVEKKATVKSLESKAGLSALSEFTDADLVGKESKPGQFKVVATGMLKIGSAAATFTIMGAGFDDPNYLAAKKIIRDAAISQ